MASLLRVLVAVPTADFQVRLFDATNGRQLDHPTFRHCDRTWSIAFGPDASLVATGADDSLVGLWQVGSADAPAALVGHTSRVRSVAIDLEGAELASASDGQSAIVGDVANRFPTRKLVDHSGLVKSGVFGSGSQLASGGLDRTVILWAPGATARRALAQHAQCVSILVFRP